MAQAHLQKNEERKTMKIIVDTREKQKQLKLLKQLGITYERKKLDAGDYEAPGAVFERKTVYDLIQSVRTMKLFSELNKLIDYCEKHQKVPYLLVSGTIEQAKNKFKKMGLKVNEKSLWGAIASATVRYGVNVIWNLTDDVGLLYVMYRIAEKIQQGKYMMPHRLQLRRDTNKRIALVSQVLHVSPTVAKRLLEKFGSLRNILLAPDNKLRYVDGIGQATLKRI